MPAKRRVDADEESTTSESDDDDDDNSSSGSGSTDASDSDGSSDGDTKKPPPKAAATKKAPAAKPAPAPKAAPAAAPVAATRQIANNPNDEEHVVDEGHRDSPTHDSEGSAQVSPGPRPGAAGARPGGRPGAAAPAAGSAGGGGQQLRDNPHDESYVVDDDDRRGTPPARPGAAATSTKPPMSGPGSGAAAQPSAGLDAGNRKNSGLLKNEHNDEFEDVEDDMPSDEDDDDEDDEDSEDEDAKTPPKKAPPPKKADGLGLRPGEAPRQLKNQPHDFAVDAEGSSHGSPSGSSQGTGPSPQKGIAPLTQKPSTTGAPGAVQPLPQRAAPAAAGKKAPPARGHGSDDDDDDDDDSSAATSTDDEEAVPKMKGNVDVKAAAGATSGLEYNPADYAHLKGKVSREVLDLFQHITAYTPTVMECPSKLRPFVPDFVPCVGDIDTFCKVPRPDGKPDNLGLITVDEPSSHQSNPAIVKMMLETTSRNPKRDTYVISVENAHTKGQVIDKWIADVKGVHYKKPLPTVTYSKTMPDIERLLQVWPQEFEEMLSTDSMLPPPQIDLDIHQYVRVLCSILDIPTYGSLIESLHVMFTLYLEFRQNQHFQHA